MKSLIFVAVGVVLGFLLAHRVSRTEAGTRFFSEVDSRAKAFTGAVADGYRSREAELRADAEPGSDPWPGAGSGSGSAPQADPAS